MTNFTQYRDTDGDTTKYPTPAIWADCPVLEMIVDPSRGVHFYDDFSNAPKTDAGLIEGAGESAGNGYVFYGDTGVVMKAQSSATEGEGQALEVSGNDADNDEGSMSLGSPAFMVSDTGGYDNKLWFEARIKSATVADNGVSQFIGLAWDFGSNVPVAGAEALVDNTGALGAFSYLGFHCDAANGDAWDFVYKAEGDSQTVAIAGVDVGVADTYAKFGFIYDPSAPDANKITVYVDGVKSSTYVTAANIAAAAFPDAESLAPTWATKVGSAAAVLCNLDWWRCAQLR